MNKGLSSALDASRWIAALMVVISHVHHLVLANFPNVSDKSLLWKGFYFFGSFGGEAVIIFFVVSGYLVGGLTSAKWMRQREGGQPPQMGDYAMQRVSRIYTVLIPALLAGWAFDYFGSTFFDGAQLYTNSEQYRTISMNNVIAMNLGPQVFLGNLLMLAPVTMPVLGSNGPLWSLAYEWWYYCIFAAALGALLYRGASRWACLTFTLLALFLLPGRLLIWMSVWLLGIGAYYYVKSERAKPHPLLGLAVLAIGLIISRFSHSGADTAAEAADLGLLLQQISRDFALGLSYAFAVVGFSRLQRPLWMADTHAALASFSYSMYLTHFPLMVLLVAMADAILGIDFLRQPSFASYLYVLTLVMMLYAFGFVFSLATERHTAAVRAALGRLVTRPQVRPATIPGAEGALGQQPAGQPPGNAQRAPAR